MSAILCSLESCSQPSRRFAADDVGMDSSTPSIRRHPARRARIAAATASVALAAAITGHLALGGTAAKASSGGSQASGSASEHETLRSSDDGARRTHSSTTSTTSRASTSQTATPAAPAPTPSTSSGGS